MDAHRRELARRIFVVMTELLEDTHETTVAGQSPRLNVRSCLQLARNLREAGHDLTVLADAAAIVARQGPNRANPPSPARRMKRRRKPK
jgi:hypothetical protein